MAKTISHFFRNRFVMSNLIAAILLNLALLALLVWRIKPVSEPIPLHYNIYFGPDLIGPWQRAFSLPVAGFLFLSFNFFLSAMLLFEQKMLGYLLVGMTTLVQIFLLVGGVALVLINI